MDEKNVGENVMSAVTNAFTFVQQYMTEENLQVALKLVAEAATFASMDNNARREYAVQLLKQHANLPEPMARMLVEVAVSIWKKQIK